MIKKCTTPVSPEDFFIVFYDGEEEVYREPLKNVRLKRNKREDTIRVFADNVSVDAAGWESDSIAVYYRPYDVYVPIEEKQRIFKDICADPNYLHYFIKFDQKRGVMLMS